MAEMAMEPELFLDPEKELPFEGSYTKVTQSVILVTNPLNFPLAFKVKTNAPKMYCVRPYCGVIEPMDTVGVVVKLLPIVPGTIYSGKKTHKIVVQARCAPSNDVNLLTFWKESSPEEIVTYKLTCVFDPPLENYLVYTDSEAKDAGAQAASPSHSILTVKLPLEMSNDGEKVKGDEAKDKQTEDKVKTEEVRELEPLCFNRPALPALRETPAAVAAGSEVCAFANVDEEGGLRPRLFPSTVEAQQQQSPAELDDEKVVKKDQEAYLKKDQEDNLVPKCLCIVFGAVVFFMLGIIFSSYLQ